MQQENSIEHEIAKKYETGIPYDYKHEREDVQNYGYFTRANRPNSDIHPFGRTAVGDQLQPPTRSRDESFELWCYFGAGIIAGALLLGLIWGVL